MADIQSAAAEIRRGEKKIDRKRRNHMPKYNGLLYYIGQP